MTELEHKNLQTIQTAFAAFNSGDLESLLALMADSLDWKAAGHEKDIPWAKHYDSNTGVQEYLADIAGYVEFEPLHVRQMIAHDNQVIVFGSARIRVRANRAVAETDFAMEFRLESGKICYYRDYYDTAAYAAALREVQTL